MIVRLVRSLVHMSAARSGHKRMTRRWKLDWLWRLVPSDCRGRHRSEVRVHIPGRYYSRTYCLAGERIHIEKYFPTPSTRGRHGTLCLLVTASLRPCKTTDVQTSITTGDHSSKTCGRQSIITVAKREEVFCRGFRPSRASGISIGRRKEGLRHD